MEENESYDGEMADGNEREMDMDTIEVHVMPETAIKTLRDFDEKMCALENEAQDASLRGEEWQAEAIEAARKARAREFRHLAKQVRAKVGDEEIDSIHFMNSHLLE